MRTIADVRRDAGERKDQPGATAIAKWYHTAIWILAKSVMGLWKQHNELDARVTVIEHNEKEN